MTTQGSSLVRLHISVGDGDQQLGDTEFDMPVSAASSSLCTCRNSDQTALLRRA